VLLSLLLSLGLSAPAHALMQPDSTVIPVGPAVQQLFDDRGEALNALNDAAITPETFVPTCKLEFEVLLRLAGYKNSFGWYNVTPNKPLLADHHEFLSCTDPVGLKKTLDIKNHPSYLGGAIGFYQAVGPCATLQDHLHIFYSEPQHNPDSIQQNPYIHLLIYNSTITPKAFYFTWEDLIQGGDNDFSDLTTLVTGITCTGGGASCQTGQLGIRADGTMQCQAGVLACVPNNIGVSETCNGLDDDCDGDTDEGEDICPNDEVCDQGSCVPKCGEKEFLCPPHEVCSPKGVCIDPDCLEIDCPSGTKCDDGNCVAPCDGVVCPYAQVCRVGACVDPCKSISCDAGQLCVKGICSDHCDCIGCAASQTCLPAGDCIPTPCLGVTCALGEYCAPDGSCQDACGGAVCPKGEVCELGQCVPDPNAGQGGAGGSPVLAGVGSSSSSTGGMAGAGGSKPSVSGDDPGAAKSGCSCRTAGGPDRHSSAWLWALGLALVIRRRREASARSSRC
jgi:MYXO-CTERM domain-containing protein